MRSNYLKATLKTAVLALSVLLGAGASMAQQQINLTAAPSNALLPDGSLVPMWGYTCGVSASLATCAPLNPAAAAAGNWSPIVITIPTTALGGLAINLTNSLPSPVPTSIVIVGQLGGGLGDVTQRTTTAAPDHSKSQGQVTWPITDPTTVGLAPAQGPRVQSFSTEVAAGATTLLPAWANLKPGTYLIESGTHPSIQGPMGLYGILVVTTAPGGATAGTAYPAVGTQAAVSYDSDFAVLLSEIDPVQNNAVSTAVNTAGFVEAATIPVNLLTTNNIHQCVDPATNTSVPACYPPAVNYTPTYYLVNGVAFSKATPSTSLFAPLSSVTTATNALVRIVNAGSHMHVPSIVGATTGTPAAAGFGLIAEDGNRLPGVTRVQSEVFMAAGKTYDVLINAPAAGAAALPIYDRELSLSANKSVRDAGMLAYLGVNGGALPAGAAPVTASASPETYYCSTGNALVVSDPGKGVLANDVGANGATLGNVSLVGGATALTFNPDGTFSYAAQTGTCGGTFTYFVNGNASIAGSLSATATITECDSISGPSTGCTVASGLTAGTITFTSNNASLYHGAPPGVLAGVTANPGGLKLTASGGGGVTVSADGGFNASSSGAGACAAALNAPAGATCVTFAYTATNSQGTASSSAATVIFLPASGLSVTVIDPSDPSRTPITDYRWIIEEDRTFFIDPNNNTTTSTGAGNVDCAVTPSACAITPTFGVNFHTSYMPVIAAGCTGTLSCESGQTQLNQPVVCDVGNGVCRPGSQQTVVLPSSVNLEPTKRYYISVLPGDAANPVSGASDNGHGMGGAPVPAACTPVPPATTCTGTRAPVTVLTEVTPFQPAKLSVFVFEDDFPLNGEHDAGGGVDVLALNEPGLGGFEIILADDAGGTGDSTGQPTYDMFNMPLSNALAGTIDPATGHDACPISKDARTGVDGVASPTGITGMIVTCPKYEDDGVTLSPLAGQAVIANLYPGRYGVIANPGADRIARGEEWLQTNTLDGQKAHDSFLRVGEPGFFQEYGPAGYHVAIGFANGDIINSRKAAVCAPGGDGFVSGVDCSHTVTGTVTTERMSRPPDQRLYSSGSNDSFAFTQCYASLGDPDGEDFAFTKCDNSGSFSFSGIPVGDWRVTIFDQWNDMLVDGLSTPVRVGSGPTTDLGQVAMNQWQANIITSSFFDQNGDGVRQDTEPGLTLVPTNIRFRDGSYSNLNNTDLSGNAGFNEVFPLFSWYVIESDYARYKNTGTHVVYDAGGPADGTPGGGSSAIAQFMANTLEPTDVGIPTPLRVPGAVYCDNADCTGFSIATGPIAGGSSGPGDTTHGPGSTGRIDPPWVVSEGWQGFSGQNSFIEFGKTPYAACPPACVTGTNMGENGGIRGHVIYASTRPFDDPQLLLQLTWEPMVPHVTVNLYQEGSAPDGTTSLTLVDHTQTSSWDDWAQGFRSDGVPNMNCPGQGRNTGTNADLFFFSLYNQPNYLDLYNSQHGGLPATSLPLNSQFKCYDGMHNWNQIQPAPYDGMYAFPSVTALDPTSGKPTGTNCTICVLNPDVNDPYRHNLPMLPAGKYVVEVIVPPGYELVKEEDKNILIGDTYVAPVTQQFAGLGAVYIIPDQAEIASQYNPNNAQNPTNNLSVSPRHEGDTGSVEVFWPCVGASRMVPDYLSLFPQAQEVSPFAGATRNLCDRKEVTLEDQMSALAKFYVFSSTHIAAHFTGVITDDFTSEFDPFSPQFGEKFSPANLPISIKDFNGNEITRIATDHWGAYDGLNYSTWEVNPPNPTGYAPQMMVTCMNDPGTDANPDPLFNEAYSQFCYETPFMPGQTQYMDTPVVPTSAFAGAAYNNPDCAYPAGTPSIAEVDGDQIGPWVSVPGHNITITALGDQLVNNYAYSGPSAGTAPFSQKKVTRHYGFGTRCTSPSATSATCNTVSTVAIGGAAAAIVSWNDTTIVATVPGNVPACAVQQQVQYGNPNTTGVPGQTTRCGELVITAGNGRQSVDTVTVTVHGKTPTHVPASGSIQQAIDAAAPGDLIIVDPTCTTATGTATACTAPSTTNIHSRSAHTELLLMWKPVRLQGVGARSSIIDANTHPAGKLDPWRASVNCLFGLALNGQPNSGTFDSSGTYSCPTPSLTSSGTGPDGNTWTHFYGGPNIPTMVVDRVPREGILGWDATTNGNLAEQLQEPSLMGAYEGAAITVLSKGVNIPAGSADPFGSGAEADFPAGTTLLSGFVSPSGDSLTGDLNPLCHTSLTNLANPYPSNFQCNPSSIDGLGITNSSQGGGGIMVHGWGHNVQIANNRIYNNAGTLSGGISLGLGEFTDAYLAPNSGALVPGSCLNDNNPADTNVQLPYCFNLNTNVHHNMITTNSSTGDELFAGTPAGAGGVSICTGADYYKFNYNWICGNLSTGDGGGVGHLGFIYNGDIEHNSFLFNQSTNPSIQSNGGGLIVMGAAPDATITVNGVAIECGSVTDNDCVPGLSDGAGPGLLINANLFEGNAAEAGSGGGLRLQAINGTEVAAFPSQPARWYHVQVQNNIINNNVAGWDGAGVSLEDALAVTLINNTISSNDTTASSGVLFNTLGAPVASSQSPAPTCQSQSGGTASCPQPAGLVVLQNSPQLTSSFTTGAITCPPGNYAPGTSPTNGTCIHISYPALYNNIFWQNRSFDIAVGGLGAGTLNQQNVVTLHNASGTIPGSQTNTGSCPTASSYWDIGVRNDTGPTNHASTYTLNPLNGVLTNTSGYSSTNLSSNPGFVTQYCNGSRVPPEFKSLGYQVPPGIADATVPNPIFNLTAAATVDEGNNWINISWGPLSMLNPVTSTATTNIVLGNYSLQGTSPALNHVPCNPGPGCLETVGASGVTTIPVPSTDFFGHPRPDTGRRFDVGAVEVPNH